MRKLLYKSSTGIGLTLFSSAALAETQEELLTTLLGQIQMYAFIAFAIIVIAGVYFMRSRDKRQTPLKEYLRRAKRYTQLNPIPRSLSVRA